MYTRGLFLFTRKAGISTDWHAWHSGFALSDVSVTSGCSLSPTSVLATLIKLSSKNLSALMEPPRSVHVLLTDHQRHCLSSASRHRWIPELCAKSGLRLLPMRSPCRFNTGREAELSSERNASSQTWSISHVPCAGGAR